MSRIRSRSRNRAGAEIGPESAGFGTGAYPFLVVFVRDDHLSNTYFKCFWGNDKLPSEWLRKPVVSKRLNNVRPRTIVRKENLISANSEMLLTILNFHARMSLQKLYINNTRFFEVRHSCSMTSDDSVLGHGLISHYPKSPCQFATKIK